MPDPIPLQTCWVERQAVMGKSRHGVVRALTTLEQPPPFPLPGIDSDNGSEFINDPLGAFCQDRPVGQAVQFTRSRPYKKDDNAHVEQKNWTRVRKLVGWERYDSPAALQALHALYADLRLFQNLFQPSMKLVRTVRVGARLIRRYDPPQTPFEQVKACAEADPQTVAALEPIMATTDPFVLSQRIDRSLERLWALATRDGPPAAAAASDHALARVDVQSADPTAPTSPCAARCQKTGAHSWLRNDDHQAGQGRGQGENSSPGRLRPW